MSKINFFALGGLGENGKNLYVLEFRNKETDDIDGIFLLDAGLKYPTDELYGVDTLLPNISYIIEHKDKVKAIFLSHGHEEQIGGVLEILKVVSVGVFASHFTISVFWLPSQLLTWSIIGGMSATRKQTEHQCK